jgi:cytochrome c
MTLRQEISVLFGAVCLLAAPVVAFAAEPDMVKGQQVFAACAACHATEQPVKSGPDLRGIDGRKAGSSPGFRYSRAMKNSKIVWNEATLDEFLAEPQARVPGNVMPYPGLPDESQRRDLIAYLKTLK